MKNLALPFEVGKNDRRPPRKLPNDLTTRPTRRRQRLRIGHNRELGKIPLTFRQRLPDRNAFGANSQAITW